MLSVTTLLPSSHTCTDFVLCTVYAAISLFRYFVISPIITSCKKNAPFNQRDKKIRSTEVGFEPTHALHIGLAGQRLNHSAILPPQLRWLMKILQL
jgi:hypothetical protein